MARESMNWQGRERSKAGARKVTIKEFEIMDVKMPVVSFQGCYVQQVPISVAWHMIMDRHWVAALI